MVPVASCVRVWSMRMAISLPGLSVPETRCRERIFSVMFMVAESVGWCDGRGRKGARFLKNGKRRVTLQEKRLFVHLKRELDPD